MLAVPHVPLAVAVPLVIFSLAPVVVVAALEIGLVGDAHVIHEELASRIRPGP